MEEHLVNAFTNLGAVGLMLWWITQKLIPSQLAWFERRSEALQKLFKDEMEMERQLHRAAVEKTLQAAQERDKLWMSMMNGVLTQMKDIVAAKL